MTMAVIPIITALILFLSLSGFPQGRLRAELIGKKVQYDLGDAGLARKHLLPLLNPESFHPYFQQFVEQERAFLKDQPELPWPWFAGPGE